MHATEQELHRSDGLLITTHRIVHGSTTYPIRTITSVTIRRSWQETQSDPVNPAVKWTIYAFIAVGLLTFSLGGYLISEMVWQRAEPNLSVAAIGLILCLFGAIVAACGGVGFFFFRTTKKNRVVEVVLQTAGVEKPRIVLVGHDADSAVVAIERAIR